MWRSPKSMAPPVRRPRTSPLMTPIVIRTDVTDETSLQAAVRTTVQQFGALHILHNNAGGSTPQDNTVVEAPIEEFWRVIKLDLFGTFLGCRVGIPEIIRSGGGSVINMSSNVALMGIAGRDCYTAAKGGVAAITRSMAVEFATQRVRVNAIAPSATMTERVRKTGGGQCGAGQAGGLTSVRADRATRHRQHGVVPRVR